MTVKNSNFATGDDLDDGLDYEIDDFDEEQSELVRYSSNEAEESTPPVITGKKRAAKTDNFREKKKQKSTTLMEEKKNLALMPKDMIADILAAKIKSKNSDLSTIELNELYINQLSFVDTLDFKLDRSLDNYPKFIKQYFSENLKQKSNGLIYILSMSALRACEVARALKGIKGGALKLVQKNKLSYDKKAIEAGFSRIAASTPGRTQKLLSQGILKYNDISAIVMDSSFLDVKISCVWDFNETLSVVKDLTSNSHAKIYLY